MAHDVDGGGLVALKIGTKQVGFNMPESKHKILERMVAERGLGRGGYTIIMNEAFNEYVERRTNPEPEKEKIRQALRDGGVIPEDKIREIVREELRSLLQGLPGIQ